ncbi:Kinesin-like protein KIF21B [Fusarium oxysporum f. sp. albedinis]|nr:Kinesin-like protein KIF21B [Fusarium oxysporum f. sp. albedinis]
MSNQLTSQAASSGRDNVQPKAVMESPPLLCFRRLLWPGAIDRGLTFCLKRRRIRFMNVYASGVWHLL